MLRGLGITTLALLSLLAACGGGGDGSPTPSGSPGPTSVPTPTPSPAAPEVESGVAVLIALGDSGTYACCGTGLSAVQDLTTHVAEQLGRPVQLVSIQGAVSAQEFIAGAGGEPSLLAQGASAIKQYQTSGHPVAAVVLSVGAADIDQLRKDCGRICQPQALEELAVRYDEQLRVIYGRLNQAMTQAVPVLQANFFDAQACAGSVAAPAGFKLNAFNEKIAAEAADHDGFVVDVAGAITPGMCLEDGSLTAEGQQALGSTFRDAYASVPEIFRPTATP